MKTRVLAILVALGVLGFVGAFIWAAMRPPASVPISSGEIAPTASVSEMLSDSGQIDVQVYATGNRDVRMDIQFMPDADAVEMVGMRPDVNFAMVEMHMDGLTPPLEFVRQVFGASTSSCQWLAYGSSTSVSVRNLRRSSSMLPEIIGSEKLRADALQRLIRGTLAGLAVFATLGTVTAVWLNPFFVRMTPVGPWELGATT